MNHQAYIGTELDLFNKAENWKSYYGSFIKPYLKGRVLEVGAGIGGTTFFLCDGRQDKWVCLEPDVSLVSEIRILIANEKLPAYCEVINGRLGDLPAEVLFDAIIYIDVIEHIQADKEQLALAAKHLSAQGALIVLAPAHQWLYTPFDASIGHIRRYNRNMLKTIIPMNLIPKKLVYLDSVGLLASLANKFLLRSSMPTEKQIFFWDKFMVSISRIVDPIFANTVGKSILGIWTKG